MTLSDALEFFKKGYKECFNLSDIKKSENHLLHSQWLEITSMGLNITVSSSI